MMARRTVLGVLAGGAAALLSGCKLFESDNTYRFRMMVEVETPQGLKTGSSVYEVSAKNKIAITREMADRSWSVKGEAVMVDLPNRQTLFALLKTANSMRNDLAQMSMAALDPSFKNDIVESAARIASGDGIRSPADVAIADYPMLVRFRDITDPTSVERVEPAAIGPGVVLRRITVAKTDEPVTTGVEKRLGWLEHHKGSLDYTGQLHPNKPEKDLTPSAFWQGTR